MSEKNNSYPCEMCPYIYCNKFCQQEEMEEYSPEYEEYSSVSPFMDINEFIDIDEEY
jgi:hypothetical protein